MDRFEWLRAQSWLAPWPAPPGLAQEPTPAIDWVFEGAASFHVSCQEQYGDAIARECAGALAPDARHLFFKTGPTCSDPTETACRLGVVCRSTDDLHVVFCFADQDVWRIDTFQVQQLVLQDAPAVPNQDKHGRRLPAFLSVIFRQVVLNLYSCTPSTSADGAHVLPRVASLFAQAKKAGPLPKAPSGAQKEGQTVHVQELARDWLHNLGEISAGARGASDALAATDLVEGALAKLAVASARSNGIHTAAREAVEEHASDIEADQEAVRWLLKHRGEQEDQARNVPEELRLLLEKQNEQYKTRLWLQLVGAST